MTSDKDFGATRQLRPNIFLPLLVPHDCHQSISEALVNSGEAAEVTLLCISICCPILVRAAALESQYACTSLRQLDEL